MRISTLLGGAALGALALAAPVAASAQDTVINWSGGAPRFTNDTSTFKVRGRTYFDYVFQDVEGGGTQAAGFSGTNTPDYDSSGFRLRTARLGVEGTWNTNWAYKAEVSTQRGTTQWEDLILEYKPNDTSSILIGNFKTLSLEDITSSRYITFMERGAYNDLVQTGRVLNIAYKTNGLNYTATAAISAGSVNDPDTAGPIAGTQGNERIGVNGRFTYAPIDTDNTKLHLGVWARYRDSGDETPFNYAIRPNTNFGNPFTATGNANNTGADSDTSFALEGALVYRNYSLQAEAANISIERRSGPDADLRGGYVAASWFPTGEMRRYEANRGEFNRTRILNPTSAGGFGALELAVRYDNIDLTDAFVTTRTPAAITSVNPRSGSYQGYTAGVNYYPFPFVRFQANYTIGDFDNKSTATDTDSDVFQLRAQFDF